MERKNKLLMYLKQSQIPTEEMVMQMRNRSISTLNNIELKKKVTKMKMMRQFIWMEM
jgi:hypothetical protein